MGHSDLNPGRVVAVRLTEMLRALLSGEATARQLPAQLRELADWIEAKAGAPEKKIDPKKPTAVRAVYEYWLHATRRNAARHKLTAERRKKIEARLRTYTVEDIKRAIDYVASSDFHQGDNDRNQRYDDITTICMNDTRMENYRNMRDVDEMPGAHRKHTDQENDLSPFNEAARLREAAQQALQKGNMDAYNQSQQQLRRLRDDAGRSKGGAESSSEIQEAEPATEASRHSA